MVPRVRGFRWSVVWPRLLLLSLLLLSAMHLAASMAQAEPYDPPSEPEAPALGELAECPQAPEGYGGEDPVAAELRSLRDELAQSCSAVAARQVVSIERTFWQLVEQLRAQEQRVVTNEFLEALKDQGLEPRQVDLTSQSLENPLPVAAAEGGAQSEATVAAIDASGEAVKEALWFAIGLMLGLAGFYGLYRQVMPRA